MKKALKITGNILTGIVMAVAVCMMVFTVVSVRTFNNTKRNLFGYKALIVLSDSMSATDFSAGDLVLVKAVEFSELQPGDIIAFQSQNEESYGEIVTHKIRERTTDANGTPGFVTYGTTTGVNDQTVVTESFIIGQYQFRLKGVGRFFQFVKTTPGYFCCIFLPFLILIIVEGTNVFRLFRRYRREQLADLESQRAELEKERQEQKNMMEELMALKAQLSAANVANAAGQGEPASPADGEKPQP